MEPKFVARGAEAERLSQSGQEWKHWGPYLAERAWGTVREDYSSHADAWSYFPHDHARSRAYRWNEDGLGGICDIDQNLCFSFAFWNGVDPILKERIFGLTGHEGNHGEDAKEYWWYTDSTPTHSWMQWRYAYPQLEFPYGRMVRENRRRSRSELEFELADTRIFDNDLYWDISVDYAKAEADHWVIKLTALNRGPNRAQLHVLPTMWFRNTWSWNAGVVEPELSIVDAGNRDVAIRAEHPDMDPMVLRGRLSQGIRPTPLFCSNETNKRRLWNTPAGLYPKDGIGDHIISQMPTVNPEQVGTKSALHYVVDVAGGESVEILLTLGPEAKVSDPVVGGNWDKAETALVVRKDEADEFFGHVLDGVDDDEEYTIARQALSGMLWTKQFYHFDIKQWLDGDSIGASPPGHRKWGRNSEWRHLRNAHVITMPDTWEYPWYAAWDLAFHCVVLAQLDPELAKEQLLLMCQEDFMHPDGRLPAYEWDFGDVNPPVHAWAALRVFEADGSTDHTFLARILHKLLLNFTWWVNRKDSQGNNVFEGGFLGLDNIGPIDRSEELPFGGRLEQSDGTAWMAMYSLNLAEIALILAEKDEAYEDLAIKFIEHFTYIACAMDVSELWNEDDGFYYDRLDLPGHEAVQLRARSMVGLLPLAATMMWPAERLSKLHRFENHVVRLRTESSHDLGAFLHRSANADTFDGFMASMVPTQRLIRIFERLFDEAEFLSPHGIRALSKDHQQNPYTLKIGDIHSTVGYEPAESTTPLFGGNSNWRGPVWFPVNYLLIESLARIGDFLGDDFLVDYPTGSGEERSLSWVANDLSSRLVSLFVASGDGSRPFHGPATIWPERLQFHEYFDGDTGRGLGASHQTGWTGLVANLILKQRLK